MEAGSRATQEQLPSETKQSAKKEVFIMRLPRFARNDTKMSLDITLSLINTLNIMNKSNRAPNVR